MPETVIEQPMCSKCGAEVRAGTQYCYNCGGFVGDSQEPAGQAGSVRTANDLSSASTTEKHASDNEKGLKAVSVPDGESNLASKSATNRRLRPNRRPVRKPVEIVWDPADEDVNTRFVIVAAVLILFALISVLVIVYFK